MVSTVSTGYVVACEILLFLLQRAETRERESVVAWNLKGRREGGREGGVQVAEDVGVGWWVVGMRRRMGRRVGGWV